MPGTGFKFNYQPSRLDRNALYAINRVFDPEKVSRVRTKYHRAKLNVNDLRNDLMEFGAIKRPRSHTDAYYAIFESVDKDIFGDAFVVPLTHGAVAELPALPKHKSPGLPYKTMGFNSKREALEHPETLPRIRKMWYAIERGEPVELPDVACYARAQICTRDKNKIRATWGYPLDVYLTEAQTFYPLLDVLKNKPQPTIAYGVEIGTGGMNYVNEMARAFKHRNFIIGDWSKFDKTVPAWLIRDAFKMIARHIDWTQVRCKDGHLWPVRPTKSKKRFAAIVKYFIDTPVQLSTGERFVKHGGVPSGSCWTNVIDGIVNALVMRYIIYSMTGSLPLDDLYLGDDSFIVVDRPVNLEMLAALAEREFSMILNVDKTFQTSNPTNIHFLGYYNIYGVPYKPIDTVVASTLYPERPVMSKFETVTRMVGQAYSCFEPEDAKKFFLAAGILKNEIEGLDETIIEDFIKEHPHWFKYLQTLGVSTRNGLTVPKVQPYDLVWLTAPTAPRRAWKFKSHDLVQLAAEAYSKRETDENFR